MNVHLRYFAIWGKMNDFAIMIFFLNLLFVVIISKVFCVSLREKYCV